MNSEIDSLMERDGIDAIFVMGSGMHNPYMVYFVGGVYHITQCDLIKKRHQKAMLFHNVMERDEAAKSGLELHNYNEYDFHAIQKETNGDELKTAVLLYDHILRSIGLTTGVVAVFGHTELGRGLSLFSALQGLFPEIHFVGLGRRNLISDAMQAKDANEIDHIRQVGQITTTVVGNTVDFLSGHRVKKGTLVKKTGDFLTVGDVKKKINIWLAENGVENAEGIIFAIGKDAAVPHSTGNDHDIIETGKTIVFDIFPCEVGGGYFHDFTRTWCLGYAPDETLQMYHNVHEIYQRIIPELKLDTPLYQYQMMTCDYFEAKGHATIRNTPGTEKGYIHSLSHGVGLNIHEKPFTGTSLEMSDRIVANSIFTIEPGLYYPDKGIGIRIEDTYWARPDGHFECMVQYPYDLVIPVKQ